MAKLDAPLLSFNARGQIAKSMVFMGWKGLKTVRQYVTPANPRAPGQVTQRNLFTVAVFFWRNFLTDVLERTAWDRTASLAATPLSGFNAFIRAALFLSPTTPAASFATFAQAVSGEDIEWTMKNLDDGAVGDEAGSFNILFGVTPQSLDIIDTTGISSGLIAIDVSSVASIGDRVYLQLRKDGQDRSGIGVFIVLA